MATSTEIKQRANALADKTDVNSITPKEVGGIMYDLASHGENVLRNGGTLGIRKVYESVSAMEADSTNPKDFWGDPIKKGNLVVIYDGTTTGVDNNKIYAFMKPGWELATKLDAAYATKAETDAKLSELSELNGDICLDLYKVVESPLQEQKYLTASGVDEIANAAYGVKELDVTHGDFVYVYGRASHPASNPNFAFYNDSSLVKNFGIGDEQTETFLFVPEGVNKIYVNCYLGKGSLTLIQRGALKDTNKPSYDAGVVLTGYITSSGISNFFSTAPSYDYLTYIKKVIPGEKIIILTDALYGDDSLAAFTDGDDPKNALKLGDNLQLKIGYNEIIAPQNATYIGVTLKFRNSLGKLDGKAISSASNAATLKKIQEIESVIETMGNVTIPLEPLSLQEGKFLESNGVLSDITSTNYIVAEYAVQAGQKIKTISHVYRNKPSVSFLNSDGEVVSYIADLTATDDFNDVAGNHIIPDGVVKMLVAGYINHEPKAATTTKSFNAKWSGKKWCCVGDSLTEKNSRTTLNYHDHISRTTGIEILNLGRSGSGYAKLKDINAAFYQRVATIPNNVDVITIFGSGNDLSSGLSLGNITDSGVETLCGCINKTIDVIQELHPLIPLGIITPTPWAGSEPSQAPNSMSRYSDAIAEICRLRGIPCLNIYYCSNLHPSNATFRELAYSKDDGNGVHPDEKGHNIIAPRFLAFLESLILPNRPYK